MITLARILPQRAEQDRVQVTSKQPRLIRFTRERTGQGGLLFAEDVDLLPDKMFRRMLEVSVEEPDKFVKNARLLFAAMQGGGETMHSACTRTPPGRTTAIATNPKRTAPRRIVIHNNIRTLTGSWFACPIEC